MSNLPQSLLMNVTFGAGPSGAMPGSKLKGAAGEEKANFTLAKSIFLLVTGSDDIANTYFTARARKLQYDVSTYTDRMAESASYFLQDLYELGARRIVVFNVPPIGCAPSQSTLAVGYIRGCDEDYNQAAQLFNTKLSFRVNYLSSILRESKMVYINVNSALLDPILHPQNYGRQIGFAVSA